jgi:murein L,D-transpeptidase YafK
MMIRSMKSQAGSRQSLAQALLLVVAACVTCSYALGLRSTSDSAMREGRSLRAPEAALVKSLLDIRDNRMDIALKEIEQLLEARPNFRLAQLIKGDLLMARTRPIDAPGSASAAPREMVDDLRAEAHARLLRYQINAPVNLVPKYVLQLAPGQDTALVVDTAKSTLFVFRNSGSGLSYVADYYITVGKNGTDKSREGDKRTPLGVYHVTGSLPRQSLTDLYGNGAYPINYPNEWDQMNGRDGHGIWLHGTPADTYSRPPRASDGCIVLSNEDLAIISRQLQYGRTPVIIADGVEWVSPETAQGARAELATAVESWRRDWESRNTETYLTHYAVKFSSRDMDLAQWAAQKRSINAGKSWIKLKLDDLSFILYPGKEEIAVVTFSQDYASNNLTNQMRKRQYWIREGRTWKILFEGAA